jgi:hypothetical protein
VDCQVAGCICKVFSFALVAKDPLPPPPPLDHRADPALATELTARGQRWAGYLATHPQPNYTEPAWDDTEPAILTKPDPIPPVTVPAGMPLVSELDKALAAGVGGGGLWPTKPPGYPAMPTDEAAWRVHWALYQHTVWQRDQAWERERALVAQMQGVAADRQRDVDVAVRRDGSLRRDCDVLRQALVRAAALSELQPWHEAFEALERVTHHCAKTYQREATLTEIAGWQRSILHAWARALNVGRVQPDGFVGLPTVPDLEAATAAIVDAERQRYHELQGVIAKLDAHRATILRFTQAADVIELLELRDEVTKADATTPAAPEEATTDDEILF